MKNDPLKKLIDLSNGDDELVREMIAIFIKHTPETIAKIKQGLEEKDYPSLSAAAHKLKSSIQIVGDKNLHELVKKIEITSQTTLDESELTSLLTKLLKELDTLLSWMKDRLDNPKKFT